MSHLLIDVGNTRIKWKLAGTASQEALVCQDYRESLNAIKLLYPVVKKVSVATVRRAESRVHLGGLIETLWQVTPTFAEVSAAAFGVTCAYTEPGRLGVDRWLAVLAAYHEARHKAVCVVDIGSATTVDVVNQQGLHLGGFIVPGLALTVSSLLSGTSGVHVHNGNFSEASLAWGENTHAAVHNGALFMQISIIEKAISLLPVGVGRQSAASLYVTGGGSDILQPFLPPGAHYIPDLVLRGLELHHLA